MIVISIDPVDRRTRYVAEIVFSRWTNWNVTWKPTAGPALAIALAGRDDPLLRIAPVSENFSRIAQQFLRRVLSPKHLERLRSHRGESLQEVFGHDGDIFDGSLSALFYLLSGAAEDECVHRDHHGRVPACESILTKLNALDLPVADIIAKYLQDSILQLAPQLPKPPKQARLVTSHDVDAPFKYAYKSPFELLRSMAGDLLRREPLKDVLLSPVIWRNVRRGEVEVDPYNCFDRILRINEKHGLKSDVYFIAGHTRGRIDGDYSLDDPHMRNLLREVSRRGHRLGLHPSYGAAVDARSLALEHDSLSSAAEAVGYADPVEIVRTHYLRFDPTVTPRLLSERGFLEDSSIAFADAAGFRRGTSRAFPLWDLAADRQLTLMEQPLIAMECSLVAARYQSLSHEEAARRITSLKAECERFGGTFVLLWHNNYLLREEDFELYEFSLR